jgi:hypothetical protein
MVWSLLCVAEAMQSSTSQKNLSGSIVFALMCCSEQGPSNANPRIFFRVSMLMSHLFRSNQLLVSCARICAVRAKRNLTLRPTHVLKLDLLLEAPFLAVITDICLHIGPLPNKDLP